jgi:hypothetical protein
MMMEKFGKDLTPHRVKYRTLVTTCHIRGELVVGGGQPSTNKPRMLELGRYSRIRETPALPAPVPQAQVSAVEGFADGLPSNLTRAGSYES